MREYFSGSYQSQGMDLKMDGWKKIRLPFGAKGLFSGANWLLVLGRVYSFPESSNHTYHTLGFGGFWSHHRDYLRRCLFEGSTHLLTKPLYIKFIGDEELSDDPPTQKLTWQWKSALLIGDTSSNGCVSSVMLVFRPVYMGIVWDCPGL